MSPADDLLDLGVGGVLAYLLGWHWEFLPSFLAKLVPGVDLVPLWTLAVANVYRKSKQIAVSMEGIRGGRRRRAAQAPGSSELNPTSTQRLRRIPGSARRSRILCMMNMNRRDLCVALSSFAAMAAAMPAKGQAGSAAPAEEPVLSAQRVVSIRRAAGEEGSKWRVAARAAWRAADGRVRRAA